MKPLIIKPAFKDYIWGGTRLKTKFGKKAPTETVAESWELSCHKDGLSIISGGEYDGKPLKSYLDKNRAALGTANKGGELPILIKLIDAADNLSVQVHPNNKQAALWENQNGKTEMWYVIDADKDSSIIYGVKNDISKDELKEAIQNNTVTNLLDSVPSKPGDVFFVEAGTIHAIGKGNLIAEIQQNSNVTYRLYDYDRRGKDGKPRELHIDKGIKAARTERTAVRKTPLCSDGTRLLGSCEYFQVRELDVKEEKTLTVHDESYQALMTVSGSVRVVCGDFDETLPAGTTVFMPAGLGDYTVSGNGTMLITSNPPRYFVGIDLGGTNIAAAVVDEYGNIYGRAATKTKMPRPYNEIFDDMALCARKSAEASGIPFDEIEAVGIGCPGAINTEKGTVEFSNNLKFYDVPILDYMEKSLGKKIYIDNDANAAAWGEYLNGSGKGTKSMVMLTLGTGVGSGIIVDGKLIRGAYDKGAELGHMVIALNGRRCTCGRNGCFEAYASATALVKMTKEAMRRNPESELWRLCRGKLSNVNGATVFRCKDETAKRVVKTYLSYLAEGTVNIINMLQPELICFGGGISHAGRRLLAPVNSMIKRKSFARFGEKQTKIGLATLGNDAGIIGAALLWKNEK